MQSAWSKAGGRQYGLKGCFGTLLYVGQPVWKIHAISDLGGIVLMYAVIRAGIVRWEWNEHAAFENPDLLFSRIELVLAVTEQNDAALVLFDRLFERQGTRFHLPNDGFQLRHGGFKGLRGGCRLDHGVEYVETLCYEGKKKQKTIIVKI
jgi:hypothetical protein